MLPATLFILLLCDAGTYGTVQIVDRSISIAEGFTIEEIYVVPQDLGSWVALAVDDDGRLIASAQGGGLYRITPGASNEQTRVEPIDSPVGGAQGLCVLDGDLYCVAAGSHGQGPGLYRIRDTDGDDHFDETTLLRSLDDGGEHGPHAVVPGPDGQLYVVAGNHTDLPSLASSVVPEHWEEDLVLPRLWDARGHAAGILAPGGWICRTDRNGKEWELVASGFRNVYDMAFNGDGELFAYDADMEWDMGAPWYRPTRINHVTSGGEFGWRSGTGKWPSWSPDSLGSVIDLGPGSPTGVCSGMELQWNGVSGNTLFVADWTFGTIWRIELNAQGSSYSALASVFLAGAPLPIADLVVHPTDNMLYFVVGGRGTASAIFRVRATDPVDANGDDGVNAIDPARLQRKHLESMHRPGITAAKIREAIALLASDDRHIAFAARIALEHQPTDRWGDQILSHPDTATQLMGVLALTRAGDGTDADKIVDVLMDIDLSSLGEKCRILYLRTWQVHLARHGSPGRAVERSLAGLLMQSYPTGTSAEDRLRCELLVAVGSPHVVEATLPLLERASTPPDDTNLALLGRNPTYGDPIKAMLASRPDARQLAYALALSHARHGWTPILRQRFFQWFDSASLGRGGHSYTGFLHAIRAQAMDHIPEQDRGQYIASPPPAHDRPTPMGPGRRWTTADVMAVMNEDDVVGDVLSGRDMYLAGQCDVCHRLGSIGGEGGPDLSALATRYTLEEIVAAITEPSQVVSDQYGQMAIHLTDGTVRMGRVIDPGQEEITIIPDMMAPAATMTLPRTTIESMAMSPISQMPPGLIDSMNAQEVRDLLAFLLDSKRQTVAPLPEVDPGATR